MSQNNKKKDHLFSNLFFTLHKFWLKLPGRFKGTVWALIIILILSSIALFIQILFEFLN